MAYATVDELNTELGHTPDGAARMLDRASRLVDKALRTAVYEVDAEGLPTDADQLAALKSATLEQCAVWDEVGSTGLPGAERYQSVSAGGISLTRAQRAGGGAPVSDTDHLAESARLILEEAGFSLGRPVRTG